MVVALDLAIGFLPLFVANGLAEMAGSSSSWLAGWVTVCAPLILGALLAGLIAAVTRNPAPGMIATLAGSVAAIVVWTSGSEPSCPTCGAWVAGIAFASIASGCVAGIAIVAGIRSLRRGPSDRRPKATPARGCGACGTEVPPDWTGWRCPGCDAVLSPP
jgi:hypothetical protein